MLILTDLDGTLLNSRHQISDKDYCSISNAAKAGHICVIATGRSLFSARLVIDRNLPIHYLVFSSGAGIMKWPDEELLFSSKLSSVQISLVKEKLDHYKIDYMIHRKVPDNHFFYWYKFSDRNHDFDCRLERYVEFSEKANKDFIPAESSQLIAVIQPERRVPELFFSDYFHENRIKVIRATSPLDKKSIWLEFYNNDVSKAKAASFIANLHAISQQETFAIGNDYNDTDMLDWCHHSYIVANAPSDLIKQYTLSSDNNSSAFSRALQEAGFRYIK